MAQEPHHDAQAKKPSCERQHQLYVPPEQGCGGAGTRAWAGVTVLGLAGAGLLVWWAVAFHPAHEHLWMVPAGLVLLGTPVVAWLSIFSSGDSRHLDRLRGAMVRSEQPPPPLPVDAVSPER